MINSNLVEATERKGKKDRFRLTLSGDTDTILAVADRPVRSGRYISNKEFVDLWSSDLPNGFSVDPPNAVIDYRDSKGNRQNVTVEILNARLTSNNLIELKVETICGIGKINRLMRDVVIWVDFCLFCTSGIGPSTPDL
jgi:hypothetical protein